MKSYTLKTMGQWSGEDLSDRGIAVGDKNGIAHRFGKSFTLLHPALTPVSLPAATTTSVAKGINPAKNEGVTELIVGDRTESGAAFPRAWMTNNGAFVDLHAQIDAAAGSFARDVNDSGAVAGWALTPEGKKAFRLNPATNLMEFPTGAFSEAYAINAQGHLVGAKDDLAFLYDGALTLIPVPEEAFSSALGINDDSIVVGQFSYLEGSRAFRYDHSAQEFIDLHEGDGQTVANAINNSKEVVGRWGFSSQPEDGVAVIWLPGESMQRLDELVTNAPDGLHLRDALSINNKGQVLARGNIGSDGVERTFLLTPTIGLQFKPDTLALLVDLILLGGGGMIRLPSGELLHPKGPPIDPGGPFFENRFRMLEPAQRDVLVGLAVQVLAKNLTDSEARRVAEMGGLQAVRKAVEALVRSLGDKNRPEQ